MLLFGSGLLNPSPVVVDYIKMLMMLEGHESTKTNRSTNSYSVSEKEILLQIIVNVISVVRWEKKQGEKIPHISQTNNFDIYWDIVQESNTCWW